MADVAKAETHGDILVSGMNGMNLLLSDEEDENSIRGVMDFDLGVLSHPKYGSAHIRGTLPLALAEGEYRGATEESVEHSVKFIHDLFTKHDLDFGDFEKRDVMIRSAVSLTSKVSKNEILSPMEISIAIGTIVLFYIDDLEEELGIGADYGGDFAATTPIFDMMEDICSGKYNSFQDIPPIDVPMLEPVLRMTYLSYELGSPELPDFKNCNAYALREFRKAGQGMLLMSAPNLLRNNACSEETFLHFRSYDIALKPSLEMFALSNGVRVIPKNIRRNLVFQRLRNAVARTSVYANDILGLRRDMRTQIDRPTNSILFKVERHGISLEEALRQVLKSMWEETSDVEFLSTKLLEYFPDEEQLVMYIHTIKLIIDTQIREYTDPTALTRYGRVDLKERWVQRNQEEKIC